MNQLAALLASDYPMELLAGMVVNFRIALIALALGLSLGVPLALVSIVGGGWQRAVNPLIGLMRAAPTFVVMFFLLNAVPRQFQLFGIDLSISPEWTVALSLVPYAAAYVADNGRTAILEFRGGSRASMLLFMPNLVRAFTVLVMSSSTGVAIGVTEGVAIVLREAERYSDLGDQMAVFAIGIFAFGVVFQTGFAIVNLVMHLLSKPKTAGAPR